MTKDDHDSLVIPLYAVGFGLLAAAQAVNTFHLPALFRGAGSTLAEAEQNSGAMGTCSRGLRGILFLSGWVLTIAGAYENHNNLTEAGNDATFPVLMTLPLIPLLSFIGTYFLHNSAKSDDFVLGKALTNFMVFCLYAYAYVWAGLVMARGREHTGRVMVFVGFLVQMVGEVLIQLGKISFLKGGDDATAVAGQFGFVTTHLIFWAGQAIWFSAVVMYQPTDELWNDGYHI